ncbi:hypothetical protein Q1695_003868 [Nippostrongylus brasiliensis]|nr:hypothetical protein Q1695_003868 [Nippostrongylus brasiliensis]
MRTILAELPDQIEMALDWKRTVKPQEYNPVGVTMSKALPFLSATIKPDVYLINSGNTQTVTHEMENTSPFPIVVKFMATAPKRFSISKNYFYLNKGASTTFEVKLSNGPIRSHRIDVFMLPCIKALNPNWMESPQIAFSTPYKPIVRYIRYKAPRPWASIIDGISQHTIDVSKNITNLCTEVGIFRSAKSHIDINEFSVLDEVFSQNLEKDPVRSGKK